MTVRKTLISVSEALERLIAGVQPLGTQTIALSKARGRILAQTLYALRTQPPFAASAMDGYAVRSHDAAMAGVELDVVGEVAAGYVFGGVISKNQTVRNFTGAPLPEGADAILIQEDATILSDEKIITNVAVKSGSYVRPAGLDFCQGDLLLDKSCVLNAGELSLAASGNHASVPVFRKPIVGILATGDELRQPGEPLEPGQIIASNSYGVAAIAQEIGADIVDLGIARDSQKSLSSALTAAIEAQCDVLVTLGGASVGDHDLVRSTFVHAGMQLDFWKIAMQPGKPLMFGTLGDMRILGLPGNPVSSLVCAHLFLAPLIAALGGRKLNLNRHKAKLIHDVKANGDREQYARAMISRTNDGFLANVFENQDSSMLSLYANANGLVIRPPNAAAASAGQTVDFVEIARI